MLLLVFRLKTRLVVAPASREETYWVSRLLFMVKPSVDRLPRVTAPFFTVLLPVFLTVRVSLQPFPAVTVPGFTEYPTTSSLPSPL